eukprot:363994-Chlamydomonas_euryale.AAC.3
MTPAATRPIHPGLLLITLHVDEQHKARDEEHKAPAHAQESESEREPNPVCPSLSLSESECESECECESERVSDGGPVRYARPTHPQASCRCRHASPCPHACMVCCIPDEDVRSDKKNIHQAAHATIFPGLSLLHGRTLPLPALRLGRDEHTRPPAFSAPPRDAAASSAARNVARARGPPWWRLAFVKATRPLRQSGGRRGCDEWRDAQQVPTAVPKWHGGSCVVLREGGLAAGLRHRRGGAAAKKGAKAQGAERRTGSVPHTPHPPRHPQPARSLLDPFLVILLHTATRRAITRACMQGVEQESG